MRVHDGRHQRATARVARSRASQPFSRPSATGPGLPVPRAPLRHVRGGVHRADRFSRRDGPVSQLSDERPHCSGSPFTCVARDPCRMADRRPIATDEMLGLLGAVLVVLLLLPARTPATFTVFAVVLAVSVTTLGVAVAALTYRGRSLDVTDGIATVAAAVLLTVPVTLAVVVLSTVTAGGAGTVSPATVEQLASGAVRLVLQWALPAALAFPFGLARTTRSRGQVGLAFLVALAVVLVVVPTPSVAALGRVLVRFVGATLLGGPLFVAARVFPRDSVPSLFGVR